MVGHAQKLVKFPLGLLLPIPVQLVELAHKFHRITLNLVDIIICHPSPPARHIAFNLEPFAFEDFLVHRRTSP